MRFVDVETDGVCMNTRIIDPETGKQVPSVHRLEVTFVAGDAVATGRMYTRTNSRDVETLLCEDVVVRFVERDQQQEIGNGR